MLELAGIYCSLQIVIMLSVHLNLLSLSFVSMAPFCVGTSIVIVLPTQYVAAPQSATGCIYGITNHTLLLYQPCCVMWNVGHKTFRNIVLTVTQCVHPMCFSMAAHLKESRVQGIVNEPITSSFEY